VVITSPYHHESNDLAESSVKALKLLLEKTGGEIQGISPWIARVKKYAKTTTVFSRNDVRRATSFDCANITREPEMTDIRR